jgi:hypothetical protein
VGALILGFSAGVFFGIAFVLLTGVWLYDTGSTACSRCGLYGTGHCGVQAWGVALLWKKRSASTVSLSRVRLHFYFDIVMMLAGTAAYSQCLPLLPFFVAWVAVGWWVVYGPKRFHALLFRLQDPAPKNKPTRWSLPVLPEPLEARQGLVASSSHVK